MLKLLSSNRAKAKSIKRALHMGKCENKQTSKKKTLNRDERSHIDLTIWLRTDRKVGEKRAEEQKKSSRKMKNKNIISEKQNTTLIIYSTTMAWIIYVTPLNAKHFSHYMCVPPIAAPRARSPTAIATCFDEIFVWCSLSCHLFLYAKVSRMLCIYWLRVLALGAAAAATIPLLAG